MTKTRSHMLTVLAVMTLIGLCISRPASAQYPVARYDVVSPGVAYTAVQPEVVGYQFQWRGLLGLRSEWQPVVAPVARTYVTPSQRTTVYTQQPVSPPAPSRPVIAPAPAPVPSTTLSPVPTTVLNPLPSPVTQVTYTMPY